MGAVWAVAAAAAKPHHRRNPVVVFQIMLPLLLLLLPLRCKARPGLSHQNRSLPDLFLPPSCCSNSSNNRACYSFMTSISAQWPPLILLHCPHLPPPHRKPNFFPPPASRPLYTRRVDSRHPLARHPLLPGCLQAPRQASHPLLRGCPPAPRGHSIAPPLLLHPPPRARHHPTQGRRFRRYLPPRFHYQLVGLRQTLAGPLQELLQGLDPYSHTRRSNSSRSSSTKGRRRRSCAVCLPRPLWRLPGGRPACPRTDRLMTE